MTIVASLSTPYAYEFLHLTPVRYWLFQNLASLGWHTIEPTDVRLVLIGNEEYWRGDLEARVPTKRDYLARIVRALDEADARVIGLDFDLRLGDPELPAVPGDFGAMEQSYRAETDTFIETLIEVANRRKIVLVKTIRPAEGGGGHGHEKYVLEPDVYQLYGLCTDPEHDGSWHNPGFGRFVISGAAARNITCGYISLPYDLQSIPGRIETEDGEHVNSLALCVARAFRPDLPDRIGDHISYASYISKEKFAEANVMVPVRKLLSVNPKAKEETRQALAGKAVIVGTQWSLLAYNRGPTIDVHITPVGALGGPYILANFIEAFLAERSFPTLPHSLFAVLEFVFSLAAAVVFTLASDWKRLPEFWTTIISLVGLWMVLVFFQWMLLQLFGVFFDAFIPVLALAIHSLGESTIKAAFKPRAEGAASSH